MNEVLKDEFNTTLGGEGVHILDPFTGTGTFISRLLQSGLISADNLERKYRQEIHANEIVLLAYYIAAVNIESAFRAVTKTNEYEEFNGICLTDTFRFGENVDKPSLLDPNFEENSERREKQMRSSIRIIIGNPPYSFGQKSENDNAKNTKYPRLDGSIQSTYGKQSNTRNRRALYDSYVRAIRWSSERIKNKHRGGVHCVYHRKCLDREGIRRWDAQMFGK